MNPNPTVKEQTILNIMQAWGKPCPPSLIGKTQGLTESHTAATWACSGLKHLIQKGYVERFTESIPGYNRVLVKYQITAKYANENYKRKEVA